MQQRYYDPAVGQFLSVDPVTAYDQPLVAFNRYRYANSNPYRFTDPDGRFGSSIERAIDRDIMARANGEISNEEYFDRAEARAAGGIAGLAVLAGARSPSVLRGALKMAAQRAVNRQEANRPNGVPKDWVAEKPAKGPGTIYRNPENPKHDTVRAVPGRPESSQPGQQTDHIVRTANGARYGESNTPVPVKSTESHVSPEKFKFVPADKLPKP